MSPVTKTIKPVKRKQVNMKFESIDYNHLNPRQKENYNYHKVSAVLADYGYTTMRLSDDYQGADFLAIHVDGNIFKVQLKGRLSFNRSYMEKDLYIAFPAQHGCWYIYLHDELLKQILEINDFTNTESWLVGGDYHIGQPNQRCVELLTGYRICPIKKNIDESEKEASKE